MFYEYSNINTGDCRYENGFPLGNNNLHACILQRMQQRTLRLPVSDQDINTLEIAGLAEIVLFKLAGITQQHMFVSGIEHGTF